MSICRLPFVVGMLLVSVAWIGLGQTKPKPNFAFGKVQDLEIDLVSVPDSVGSGGKPAPTEIGRAHV